MTGRPEARPGPYRAPPARRTRPSPTAHRTILPAPIPMAPRPPPLLLVIGTSRLTAAPAFPRLLTTLHGQTPAPYLASDPERAFEIPIHLCENRRRFVVRPHSSWHAMRW